MKGRACCHAPVGHCVAEQTTVEFIQFFAQVVCEYSPLAPGGPSVHRFKIQRFKGFILTTKVFKIKTYVSVSFNCTKLRVGERIDL